MRSNSAYLTLSSMMEQLCLHEIDLDVITGDVFIYRHGLKVGCLVIWFLPRHGA
jgi:hypothetical protein